MRENLLCINLIRIIKAIKRHEILVASSDEVGISVILFNGINDISEILLMSRTEIHVVIE